ncbi:proteasome subunit beta type 2 [Heterostelium album PN500]|uniref:Proteasome subunit beta n=1 Tax=Heterostelium pallidum (strain ATCC 26659 / Pp 5 / PN500) TaxID=670386 RepID=D3BAH6_HETP5|nr:proteasome subunit beta type 2 [Heterostelium album PN500]EFA81563.1 proteasome subunit beta type 2 [Heterostelium album PN500]|eukprot:XP_020433680.1 proteasome subunit beta type 2 [Heterostelium album PN500]
METLLSFVVADGVLCLADSNINHSIVKMKEDEDKIAVLDEFKLLSSAGEPGDRTQFCEFIAKNLKLYQLRNGYSLSTSATAHFIRNELATALRRNPYNVNLLVAGYDEKTGPAVYYMDYLASLQKLDFGCHGYAAYFLLGLLDRLHHKDMSYEEGVELMHKCCEELQTRFLVGGKYTLKYISKDGIQVVPFKVGDRKKNNQP